MDKMVAESIMVKDDQIFIINQLLLPSKVSYEQIHGVEDAWNAINRMKTRGAPAIAIIGLLGLAVELGKCDVIVQFNNDSDKLYEYVEKQAKYLCTSRPTAVNIEKEFNELLAFIRLKKDLEKISFDTLIDSIRKYCHAILEKDRMINKKIGEYGCEHICNKKSDKKQFNILTHCNTGSLATAGYGTALGVIRHLHSKGFLAHAYCTETRPYYQGSRLTAWELMTDNIPSTLICDNMVAWLMETKKIDAVIVGADRVAINGDTANKIGTYQISILAKFFSIPFYVASPLSTIDSRIDDGTKIPIEERSDSEMKTMGSIQIAPTDMKCWNPSFDITPARLITGGIITECGVIKPENISNLF